MEQKKKLKYLANATTNVSYCMTRKIQEPHKLINMFVNPKNWLCERIQYGFYLSKLDFSIIQEWPGKCASIWLAC